MPGVDINCDMGESSHLFKYDIEKDYSLLPYVSSVNLACGYHAGDAHTMHLLVEAALERKIAIGAHPGFYDRKNFGRVDVQLSPGRIYDIVLYQLGALGAFLRVYQSRLHHVKPHGALYNMAARNSEVADAISSAVRDFDAGLVLYGLAGSEMLASASRAGLRTASEVFADRTYQEDGSLTPRTSVNALIGDEHASVQQVLQMIKERTVMTVTGRAIPIEAETICIHGDSPHALQFAKALYQALSDENISLRFV